MALASIFTGPLFSTVITLYVLILLYFPSLFLWIIFSPVLISTSILLLSLLRLGAIQKENRISDPLPAGKNDIVRDDSKWAPSKSDVCSASGPNSYDNQEPGGFYGSASFVEWDVRAPLEVIYEECEEGEDVPLWKFYPETDSDTSEDEDFPVVRSWDPADEMGFRWEGEDKDGMIEIELDGKVYNDIDEDNLIEIDIHPASLSAR